MGKEKNRKIGLALIFLVVFSIFSQILLINFVSAADSSQPQKSILGSIGDFIGKGIDGVVNIITYKPSSISKKIQTKTAEQTPITPVSEPTPVSTIPFTPETSSTNKVSEADTLPPIKSAQENAEATQKMLQELEAKRATMNAQSQSTFDKINSEIAQRKAEIATNSPVSNLPSQPTSSPSQVSDTLTTTNGNSFLVIDPFHPIDSLADIFNRIGIGSQPQTTNSIPQLSSSQTPITPVNQPTPTATTTSKPQTSSQKETQLSGPTATEISKSASPVNKVTISEDSNLLENVYSFINNLFPDYTPEQFVQGLTGTQDLIAENIPETPQPTIPSETPPTQTFEQLRSAANTAQQKYDAASKAYADYLERSAIDPSQKNAEESARLWVASKAAQAEADAANAKIAPPVVTPSPVVQADTGTLASLDNSPVPVSSSPVVSQQSSSSEKPIIQEIKKSSWVSDKTDENNVPIFNPNKQTLILEKDGFDETARVLGIFQDKTLGTYIVAEVTPPTYGDPEAGKPYIAKIPIGNLVFKTLPEGLNEEQKAEMRTTDNLKEKDTRGMWYINTGESDRVKILLPNKIQSLPENIVQTTQVMTEPLAVIKGLPKVDSSKFDENYIGRNFETATRWQQANNKPAILSMKLDSKGTPSIVESSDSSGMNVKIADNGAIINPSNNRIIGFKDKNDGRITLAVPIPFKLPSKGSSADSPSAPQAILMPGGAIYSGMTPSEAKKFTEQYADASSKGKDPPKPSSTWDSKNNIDIQPAQYYKTYVLGSDLYIQDQNGNILKRTYSSPEVAKGQAIIIKQNTAKDPTSAGDILSKATPVTGEEKDNILKKISEGKKTNENNMAQMQKALKTAKSAKSKSSLENALNSIKFKDGTSPKTIEELEARIEGEKISPVSLDGSETTTSQTSASTNDFEAGDYTDGKWTPNPKGDYLKDIDTGEIYDLMGNIVNRDQKTEPAPTSNIPSSPNKDLLDYGEYCEKDEECQSNYCDPELQECAEPPLDIKVENAISKLQDWSTELLDLMGNPIEKVSELTSNPNSESPVSKLQDWSTELLDLMGNPIQEITGTPDPIAKKIEVYSTNKKSLGESCDVPDDCASGNCDQVYFVCVEPETQTAPNKQVPELRNTKKEIVGDSKYTLGSGIYDDKPATTYIDYETGEILGYMQHGKYYKFKSSEPEGTEYSRINAQPSDLVLGSVNVKDSNGDIKVYYQNVKDGNWYEQVGEQADSKEDKLVNNPKFEMNLARALEDGRIFVPGAKPVEQLMNIGDDCTNDEDCKSNFCDKSDIIWVCADSIFAPTPIPFGNCIPGESKNYPQTCEYCNEENSMWTDWCAEQGKICGGDSEGTCYDCTDQSGNKYFEEETEPWSCSQCNSDGSWSDYCPSDTYCSESGNGKCYPLSDLIPPSQRECDPEDPDDNYDPTDCTICGQDSKGIGHWIPYCDLTTQYCDGTGDCINKDKLNSQECITSDGTIISNNMDGEEYCDDGSTYSVTCINGKLDYSNYYIDCEFTPTYTTEDCINWYGEGYYYSQSDNTCYYDDTGSYIEEETATDLCEGDETGCCTDGVWDEDCLDCYNAEWYDLWCWGY